MVRPSFTNNSTPSLHLPSNLKLWWPWPRMQSELACLLDIIYHWYFSVKSFPVEYMWGSKLVWKVDKCYFGGSHINKPFCFHPVTWSQHTCTLCLLGRLQKKVYAILAWKFGNTTLKNRKMSGLLSCLYHMSSGNHDIPLHVYAFPLCLGRVGEKVESELFHVVL